MKKLLLIPFLLLSFTAFSQRVQYFDVNGRLTTSGSGTANQVFIASGSGGSASWQTLTLPDSSTFRTVANSYSLSGMQTKLNNYGLLSGGNSWSGTQTFGGSLVLTGATASTIAGFGASKQLVSVTSTGVAGSNVVLSNTPTITSPTLSGTPVAPTPVAGDNTTKVATTAFVTTADNLKANLASPAFTGTPLLPTGTTGVTQAAGDNSTKIATTAYVDKSEILLSAITGINTLSTGATALYTVPTGKTVIVTKVVIRVTAATAITTGPTVDIGVTAGDIYASTALTALTSLNKVFGFFSTGISMAATATQVINLNINTPAVGTSQNVECLIYGNLR